MSVHITAPVWKISDLSPMQKLILLKLADNADQKGLCWPSLSSIATDCGCSVRTVSRAISHFEDQSILSHERRFNKSNMYQFNMDTVSSLGSNKDMVSIPMDTMSNLDRTQCLSNMDTGVQLTVKNHQGTTTGDDADFFFFGIDIRTLNQRTRQGKQRTKEQLIHIAKLESEGITDY